MDTDIDANADADEDEDEDVDVQFHDIQAHHRAQACGNWLKLMVIHFDAVQHLIHFIKTIGSSKVSIQMLFQTPPDRYMLPWKTLLNHKAYFPDDPSLSKTADIIGFLSANSTPIAECDAEGDSINLGKLSAKSLVKHLREIRDIPKSFFHHRWSKVESGCLHQSYQTHH